MSQYIPIQGSTADDAPSSSTISCLQQSIVNEGPWRNNSPSVKISYVTPLKMLKKVQLYRL